MKMGEIEVFKSQEKFEDLLFFCIALLFVESVVAEKFRFSEVFRIESIWTGFKLGRLKVGKYMVLRRITIAFSQV
jgi:hypothetical protein